MMKIIKQEKSHCGLLKEVNESEINAIEWEIYFFKDFLMRNCVTIFQCKLQKKNYQAVFLNHKILLIFYVVTFEVLTKLNCW